jgi:hypothetical protein
LRPLRLPKPIIKDVSRETHTAVSRETLRLAQVEHAFDVEGRLE